MPGNSDRSRQGPRQGSRAGGAGGAGGAEQSRAEQSRAGEQQSSIMSTNLKKFNFTITNILPPSIRQFDIIYD